MHRLSLSRSQTEVNGVYVVGLGLAVERSGSLGGASRVRGICSDRFLECAMQVDIKPCIISIQVARSQ